ncbi:MAG: Ig-like domain-containing protein [Bacteroidales bacterium]|nr:Ig-like domain-containing protein [Clostridium sp.]MCM1202890.1 Ig-like domain-containing protein [Bacteroidales bacterium]
MRGKWKYGLLAGAVAVLLAGGTACPAAAAEILANEETEESMELLQEGSFVLPGTDYSFDGITKTRISGYLADGTPAEDEEAKKLAAAEARANDNETLKQRQAECARYLYAGMTALERQIDVAQFALSREEFKTVISDVVNSNPELFYIRNGYKVKTFSLSDGESTQIVDYCIGFYEYQDQNYNPDRTMISAMTAQVEEVKKRVLKETLAGSMSETEKLLMLHEYIILHTEYDSEAVGTQDAIPDSDFDIYGVLVNGKAVCQGYALCYKYLSEAAGIRNIGFASNENHVWNTVTLSGEGYYVDCTWDDPTWDTLGNVRHTYFLKGEADFDNHGSFHADRICNGTAYDRMFWDNVASGIFYYRGAYYYMSEEGDLCKASYISDRISTEGILRHLELAWTKSWDSLNAAKIAVMGGNILYHDAKRLYAYHIASGEVKLLYAPDLEENELIYGLGWQDGIFRYSVRRQSVSEGEVSYNNSEQEKRQYILPENIFIVPVEQVIISGENTILLTMQDNRISGENLDLKAEVLPEDATDKRIRKWTSSDTKVAVVDINGRVKGVAPGNAVITAVSYEGVEGKYPIKVIGNGLMTNEKGDTVYYLDGNLVKDRFYEIGGNTYYLGKDGAAAKEWQTIGGKRYYFGRDGHMATGWQTIGGERYYFDKDGAAVNGWQTIAGKRYYSENGKIAVGWKKISGSRYYFDGNGIMQTGWQTVNGKRYYLQKNGKMVTGWKTIGKSRYYFKQNGVMKTGWQTVKGKRYYLQKNGKMAVGWKKINRKQYYFNRKGVMAKGWKIIKGKRYYFRKNGVMVKS